MNTKNIITEHSKVKLDIYKEYLKAYLAIMALPNVPFKDVSIVDPFAGMGKDEKGESGSALIASQVLKEKMPDFLKFGKSVHLELNEYDTARFFKLKETVPAENYIHFSSDTADKFISDVSTKNLGHSLYFIDPFGYTQISKETYDNYLFGKSNTDILIFIPVYHIYRFLKKAENEPQLKPIAEFLKDIDISDTDVQKVKSYNEFTVLIKNALMDRANTRFVYYKILDNENSNSHYALFFISKNVLGAQKFLEILDKLKKVDLFYSIISEPEEYRFIDALKHYGSLNNRVLYNGGIQCGLLPKDVRRILKSLENDGSISITCLNGYTRAKKGAFPVDYSDYTTEAKIEVHWNGECK